MTYIRKALILNNDRNPGDKDILTGNDNDVARFKEFLTSPCGGSWHEDDVYASRPNEFTKDTLLQFLKDIRKEHDVNYWMIVFTGHGCNINNGVGHDFIQLSPGNLVSVQELESWFSGSNSMIILDCCRTVAMITEGRLPVPITIPTPGGQVYRDKCEEIYLNALMAMPDDTHLIAYSCKEGEESQALPKIGSLYIEGLLGHSCININRLNTSRNTQFTAANEVIVPFAAVHEEVKKDIISITCGDQNPEFAPAVNYPPFVVVPGFLKEN